MKLKTMATMTTAATGNLQSSGAKNYTVGKQRTKTTKTRERAKILGLDDSVGGSSGAGVFNA